MAVKLKKSEMIRDAVLTGEIDDPKNTKDMLEQAGRLLDKSCSHEIAGEVLFRAEDKKWYVGTVEFVIGRANGVYVRDALAGAEAVHCEKCDVVMTKDAHDAIGGCRVCGLPLRVMTKEEIEKLVWQPSPKPKNRTSRR